MAKGLFGALKGIDAFGKTMEDVKVKTRTGAFLTLVSAAIILSFTLIEFIDYRRIYLDTSVVVDKSRDEKLNVKMNITFPRVPCYLLSLDVMDISGEQQRDITHNILKTRLDQYGAVVPNSFSPELGSELEKVVSSRSKEGYCGSCYGGIEPEGGCCNTCDQVREAYQIRGWSFTNPDAIEQCVNEGWSEKIHQQSAEGCRMTGTVRVNKVIGNFQFSPGKSYQTHSMHVHDLVPYLKDGNVHDFGHQINYFAFENDDEYIWDKRPVHENFRNRVGLKGNPLDGMALTTYKTQYMFQYFLKVVSTQFRALDGTIINTHQYSATHFERDLTHGDREESGGVHITHGMSGIPGTFINYEISPMQVIHSETRQSLAHFATSTCAIIGGVLTVASLLDSALFATSRAMKKSGSSNGYGGKLM